MIEAKGGLFATRNLIWESPDVAGVLDVVVNEGKIFFFVSRMVDGKNELWLHRFSMDALEKEACVCFSIKVAPGGWGMPILSNLIVRNEHCYVATITKAFLGYQLVLGSWDGVSKTLCNKRLTRKIDWNTSLSIGNIGADGLIAYHYPGSFRAADTVWEWVFLPWRYKLMKNGDAKVRTVYFKLK